MDGNSNQLDNVTPVPEATPTTPETNEGDKYNFRPFVPHEKAEFSDPNKLANEPQLTRDILQNEDLRPTGVLSVGGREFYVGKVLRTWPRDQAVFYTRDKKGRLIPRIFYKSRSDGGWRATPGIDKDGIISKGKGFHYTQETKLHPSLEKYLQEAELHNHIANPQFSPIEKYFKIEDLPAEVNTFDEEVSQYDDKGTLLYPQQLHPGYYDRKSMTKYPYYFQDYPFDKAFQRIGNEVAAVPGFQPDFSKPPLSSATSNHTILGPVRIDTYSATLRGEPVRWIMAHDSKGRVWIDNIAFANTAVTSYGTYPRVIDSGALTNKPMEYYQQVTALKPGRDYLDDDLDYADITPLLDNLKPIQEYRRFRGVYKNTTAANN